MASAVNVLVVDDSEDDVYFLARGFDKAGVELPYTHVSTGQEAADYLSKPGPARPLPSLVLLDLKMPGMDGHEVLEWVRSQQRLKHLPVVVLSSSILDTDMSKALHLGAQAFFSKPTAPDEYTRLATEINQRWLHVPAT